MSITSKPALLAACAVLAAGAGTGGVLLASQADASATPATAAQTGTGAATVTVTGPAGRTRTRTVAVSCRAGDDRYTVTSSARHGRRGHSVVLTVPDYSGAGSYSASVLITRHTAHSFRERTVTGVPVTLTATGGSLSYSKTLSGKRHPTLKGTTVSATASWTCSL